MKVIAISGWKRSGKDTAAERLIKQHNFVRVAFADPLKNMVAEEYKIPREYCDDPKFKEAALEQYPVMPKDEFSLNMAKMMYKEFRTLGGSPPSDYYIDPSGAFLGVMGRHVEQLYWTPRALCILKGSVNRSVDSSYWVGKALEYIQSELDDPGSNSDGQWNEGVVVSDLRYRSEVEQLRQALGKKLITVRVNRFDDCQSTDASERDLDNYKFDIVLDNRGSLEEFLAKVDGLINEK